MNKAYAEGHVLAYIYHWGREEIFNLGIKERGQWVEFIKEQKRVENEENNS